MLRMTHRLSVLAAAYLSVSVAFAAETAREQEFMVEMRDGVRLATSVYLPDGDGPWPAIIQRTPYNKASYARTAPRYVGAGYAYVLQDSRGIHKSEGEYFPFESDMPDGYDTIEWIAKQPWCDGKVGITGASAMGIAANLAAASDPPHLTAAFVIVAPEGLFNQSRFIGGVFKESHAGGWMKRQGAEDQIPDLKKRVLMDNRWRATDFVFHRHNVDIPMYNVGGWYDIFSQGNLNNFMDLQANGREGAKGNQKLIMGPFGHGQLAGGLSYPESGSLAGFADVEKRWFDHWLKGEENGIMDEPAVRYYMMASAEKDAISPKNQWIEAASWPPSSSPQRLYLHGNGALSLTAPVEQGAPTIYPADPANPVPTKGGANLGGELGPMDQRVIGDRPDYLRFTSEPLEEDVVVAGHIEVELWAATDGPDTDFMVKLVDVYPDGYEATILDNPLRARYRFGRSSAADVKMMTPGQPEKLTIDLWSTAQTFEKGHRIAVHVSSSNYPRFEVNPNTGEAPGEATIPPRIAQNSIYHDAAHPSAIVLPVIDK
jgi:predicted acyl esterase